MPGAMLSRPFAIWQSTGTSNRAAKACLLLESARSACFRGQSMSQQFGQVWEGRESMAPNIQRFLRTDKQSKHLRID